MLVKQSFKPKIYDISQRDRKYGDGEIKWRVQ